MTVYEAREAGRIFCQTEGSEHYKNRDSVEPLDLIIALGIAEDFCLANIIKYAARYGKTRNLGDIRKIADYAHILCGLELGEADDFADIRYKEGTE